MKFRIMALVSLGLTLGTARADEPKTAAPKTAAPKTAAPKAAVGGEFKDTTEQVSYIIGLDIGKKMKTSALNLHPDILARGIKDGLAGKALFTDDQIKEILQSYQAELVAKKSKEGDDYLATNKKKAGVVSLPSGLQYKVIKEGTGKTPKVTDVVTTDYEGRLVDGTVFDSSYKRGEPASFPVNKVIKGWTEALQLMKVGAKWQLYIPAKLAYEDHPPPGSPIGPNDVLVFDIELKDVKPAGEPQIGGGK